MFRFELVDYLVGISVAATLSAINAISFKVGSGFGIVVMGWPFTFFKDHSQFGESFSATKLACNFLVAAFIAIVTTSLICKTRMLFSDFSRLPR